MPHPSYSGGVVPIPNLITRKALADRAFEAQDLQQQREGRLQSRDDFNEAFKQAQMESRATSAEGRASALRDQNEAMNQIRQMTEALQAQRTQNETLAKNIEFDRQGRAERDAAGYLDQVSRLDPTSKTYRNDVISALKSYPLATETKSGMAHFMQAAETANKYDEQRFHLENIPAQANATEHAKTAAKQFPTGVAEKWAQLQGQMENIPDKDSSGIAMTDAQKQVYKNGLVGQAAALESLYPNLNPAKTVTQSSPGVVTSPATTTPAAAAPANVAPSAKPWDQTTADHINDALSKGAPTDALKDRLQQMGHNPNNYL